MKFITYVGSYTDATHKEGIHVFESDSETGDFRLRSVVDTLESPTYMALSRDCTRLYTVLGRESFGPRGRNGGLAAFAVRDDGNLPPDHGLMDVFHITDEITNRGNAAQAFGEGFDTLRREGKRYVVLKDDGTRFFDFFFDRFLFEEMPGMPGYKRLRITVPGVEGPVY